MRIKITLLCAIAFLFLITKANAQDLTLTGPTSSSYCDVSGLSYIANAPFFDDAFDKINWRYKFSLWSDGEELISHIDNNVANWTFDYSDYAFESGPYQVKLEVQYKWAFFWITSETLWSNGINLNLYGTIGEYDANRTSYRMVSGDFDNDGKENDIAAFYDYGSNTTGIHVWESDGSYFDYQGDAGWWYGTSFNAQKVTGRVVSGDFDRDGYKDDIAAVYDYGSNHSIIHVWTSNGSTLNYAGEWWVSGWGASGYNADKVKGRVVSGDFDRDGYEDDICMFYGYGSFTTNAHVFSSNGSSFSFAGSWYGSGSGNFEANRISYKVVSGDFDRDGYKDDITGFYAYNGALTKGFVWKSTGSAFSSPATWYNSGSGNFDGNKITGKVVAGDFDHDGYKDDITAFYDYGGALTKAFVWRSSGSSFGSTSSWYSSGSGNFDATKINGKVVSGDFDNDGKLGDISGLYDYGGFSTRFFTWESHGSSFSWPSTTWEICNPQGKSSKKEEKTVEEQIGIASASEINVFPNPTTGKVTIELINEGTSKLEITSIDGRVIFSEIEIPGGRMELDLSNQVKGVYLVTIQNEKGSKTKKLIIK